MSCEVHKSYKGLRKPRTDCKSCWEFYNAKKESKESQATAKEEKVPVSKETSKKDEGTDSCSGGCSCTSSKEDYEEIGQLREANKLRLEEELNAYIETILERKLVEARNLVYKELSISYEYLFVDDGIHNFELSRRLTLEGWEWVHHTYPLEKNGILAKDYILFKRIKKDTNVPMPDFDDPKVLKKYKSKIKGK